MGRRRSRFGEELAEECCFECKDGGDDLRLCDYKNCLKSYHPRCMVRKEGDGDLPPDKEFICNWHACVNCRKSPDYYCLCCPNYSVCHNCLGRVKFFKLGKENKGLCVLCFALAISIEKKAADPRAKSNYQDSDMGAVLFKDYWNVIKDRERLTLIDLQEAGVLYKGLNCTREAYSEKFPAEYLLGDSGNEQTVSSGLKSKPGTSVKRKRSKKKTYVGWGTTEIIEFLSSFGKDTKEPLAEAEVVGIVREYIKQKGLFLGGKKKYFECDDKLRPLFTRRKVKYNLLHSKLRMHLAANSASEDESLDDSEDVDGPVMKKKPQANLEPKIAKRVPERNKRCLASLNLDNINHIYLRRSVVVDLLQNEDIFRQKVVGCFVRVKNNAMSHFLQKSKRSFQLGLVTDVKETKEEYTVMGITTKLVLFVAGFWDDVKISMLSEDNIQEEECTELIPLVEKGALQRATVAEFEEKAADVLTDIVNHRINKELTRLEKEIDEAHVQGWHAHMLKLMERKKLLSTPAERQRLLEAVPIVLADAEDEKEIEPKISAGDSCQVRRGKKRDKTACLVDMKEKFKEATQSVADSFEVLKEKSPKGVAEHASESLEVLNKKPPEGVAEHASESLEVLNKKTPEGSTQQAVNVFDILTEETSEDATYQVADSLRVCEEESPEGAKKMAHSHSLSFKEESSEGVAGEAASNSVTPDPVLHSPVYMAQDGSRNKAMYIDKDASNHTKCKEGIKIPVNEVIELDDSDEEEDAHGPEREAVHPPRAVNGTVHSPRTMNGGYLHMEQQGSGWRAALRVRGALSAFTPCEVAEIPMWCYKDPQGCTRGPFQLKRLLEWYNDGYFDEGFKIWMNGHHKKDDAILLTDAFRMMP